MLAQLVKFAAGRIEILACGRIREDNIRRIVDSTGVRELLTSLLHRLPDYKCADVAADTIHGFRSASRGGRSSSRGGRKRPSTRPWLNYWCIWGSGHKTTC
jgi:hypothetical protein